MVMKSLFSGKKSPHKFSDTNQSNLIISMLTHFNRRMPTGITVVQTTNDLFKPAIRTNRTKNDTFWPLIRLKKPQKSVVIVQLSNIFHYKTKK